MKWEGDRLEVLNECMLGNAMSLWPMCLPSCRLAQACARGGGLRAPRRHKRVKLVPQLLKASPTARFEGGEIDGKERIWPVVPSTTVVLRIK